MPIIPVKQKMAKKTASVIKLLNLKWDDYPNLCGCAQMNTKYPYKRCMEELDRYKVQT